VGRNRNHARHANENHQLFQRYYLRMPKEVRRFSRAIFQGEEGEGALDIRSNSNIVHSNSVTEKPRSLLRVHRHYCILKKRMRKEREREREKERKRERGIFYRDT